MFPQKIISSLMIQKAETHALYRCTVTNKVGGDSRIIFFHVTRKLHAFLSFLFHRMTCLCMPSLGHHVCFLYFYLCVHAY